MCANQGGKWLDIASDLIEIFGYRVYSSSLFVESSLKGRRFYDLLDATEHLPDILKAEYKCKCQLKMFLLLHGYFMARLSFFFHEKCHVNESLQEDYHDSRREFIKIHQTKNLFRIQNISNSILATIFLAILWCWQACLSSDKGKNKQNTRTHRLEHKHEKYIHKNLAFHIKCHDRIYKCHYTLYV